MEKGPPESRIDAASLSGAARESGSSKGCLDVLSFAITPSGPIGHGLRPQLYSGFRTGRKLGPQTLSHSLHECLGPSDHSVIVFRRSVWHGLAKAGSDSKRKRRGRDLRLQSGFCLKGGVSVQPGASLCWAAGKTTCGKVRFEGNDQQGAWNFHLGGNC